MERIKYTCKNCGWSATGNASWPDIKPKRCPNKRCRMYFLAFPDKLQIDLPKDKKAEKSTIKTSKSSKKSTKKDFKVETIERKSEVKSSQVEPEEKQAVN